jgi:hypothetical protein
LDIQLSRHFAFQSQICEKNTILNQSTGKQKELEKFCPKLCLFG